LAIFGDVMPQDTFAPAAADAGNADLAASQDPSQSFQLPPQLPSQVPAQLDLGPSQHAVSAAVPNVKSSVASSTEANASNLMASVPQNDKSGPEALAAAPDPRFEIKRESTPAPRTGPNQKPAETSDVAFAARIAQQTGAKTAINFNDVSDAIAASRFESAGGRGFSGSRDHAAPNPAAMPENTQTDQAAEAAAERPSQVLADSQLAPDPAARQTAGAQGAGSSPGIQGSAGAAIAGARAVAESVNSQSGMTGIAASSAGTSEARSASAGKTAADSRPPQFLEPAQETPVRNGESVKDISLRLTDKDQGSVQVRLSERAGELRVSVRTPDAGLTRGLRDGLSDLVGRLEHSGYKAETWQPANSSSTAQDQGRQPSQDNSSRQQQGGSGNESGQQQNARDHQQPDAQTPQWVGELESSLKRSDNKWQPAQ
jgi:hypothetical protein